MPATRSKAKSSPPRETTPPSTPKPKSTKSADATLAKKLKQLETFQQTPFPEFARPSKEECQAVCDALATVHPLPVRPAKIENLESVGANCGLVPDVLDALVRTILSQNTTSKNSTTARQNIEEHYGKGPNYEAVRLGSQEELKEAIQSGGLANVKARVIKKILDQVYEKEGKLSLDRLHTVGDEDALRELVSFDGVGPKTASCVLLFCMGRESFAVDTHVFRISKALNWVPLKATRETAFQHLDVRIPGNLKYALHALFVTHGKKCKNCSANATPSKEEKSNCPLVPFLSKRPTKALETDGAPKGKVEDESEEEMHGLESPVKRKREVKDEVDDEKPKKVQKAVGKKSPRGKKVKEEAKEEDDEEV